MVCGDRAKLLIHFTPEDIVRGTPHAIPCDGTVIILEEMVEPEETLIVALGDLIIDGFELAINNFEGKPGCERLAELADTLIVDINDKSEEDLKAIIKRAESFGASNLVAKRVENAEDLATAKAVGFTLFKRLFLQAARDRRRTQDQFGQGDPPQTVRDH